jgi:23S rRNA pseudouridine1911/1915/1917 synthase
LSVSADNSGSDMRFGQHLVIKVGPKYSDIRLDKYLQKRFGQLSRAKLQRIIRSQNIIVNGTRAKPSRKINWQDTIELDLPDRDLLSEEMPLDIIYEDEAIIVVNKQPGRIIHPGRGNPSGTILNGLVHYAKFEAGEENEPAFEPGVIHRLDKETSGTIIFSKNSRINDAVSEQFRRRTVGKEYIALVHGEPSPPQGLIDKPIGPDSRFIEKYAVTDAGRSARTRYRLRESFKTHSLIEIQLETGRTHQIRVHLADMGHPLAADEMYGGTPLYRGGFQPGVEPDYIINRVALHSWRLEIDHPLTGKRMLFESPLPADMLEALEYLRNRQLETQ